MQTRTGAAAVRPFRADDADYAALEVDEWTAGVAGLMDASVCTIGRDAPPSRDVRSTALTIPAVTVPDRPSGEPTARTSSPTPAPGCERTGLLPYGTFAPGARDRCARPRTSVPGPVAHSASAGAGGGTSTGTGPRRAPPPSTQRRSSA